MSFNSKKIYQKNAATLMPIKCQIKYPYKIKKIETKINFLLENGKSQVIFSTSIVA